MKMNADIAAKIRLYLTLHHIIKIKIHNRRYLRLSAVKNEIEIIPACFLSAHALSVGWGWCVRAVASGVVGAAGALRL
jgi:hypothetical protein